MIFDLRKVSYHNLNMIKYHFLYIINNFDIVPTSNSLTGILTDNVKKKFLFRYKQATLVNNINGENYER